jgi:hypothetical protein
METILMVLAALVAFAGGLLVYVVWLLEHAVVLRGPGVPEAVAMVLAAQGSPVAAAGSDEPVALPKPKRLSWAKTRARLEHRLTPEEERTLRVREHLGQ